MTFNAKSIIKTVPLMSNKFAELFAVLCKILLAVLPLMVSYAAISRYFWSRPFGWVVEVSEFFLIAITFLSAAWVFKKDSHVRVDVFLNMMSQKWKNRIFQVTRVLFLVVLLILIYSGALVIRNCYVKNITTVTSFSFPQYILIAIITVGLFLLFLQLLFKVNPD